MCAFGELYYSIQRQIIFPSSGADFDPTTSVEATFIIRLGFDTEGFWRQRNRAAIIELEKTVTSTHSI